MRRVLLVLLVLALPLPAEAARIADVANTKHNLSASGTGTAHATSGSTEICVFCHTPHGASTYPGAPLWNRQLSSQTYTTYTSSSLDAEDIAGQLDQPGGSSKLCLSCHDGTLAIGAVNVLGGKQNQTIPMTGTGANGTLPAGSGAQTGFTRDLGVDLRNDHPVSITFDSRLATRDGELFDPQSTAHIGVASPGHRPKVPLEATGAGGGAQVQCATCHDPHLRDDDPSGHIKFLRLQRFQQAAPVGNAFNDTLDIVCLACHDKKGWATSAHALPSVANETYNVASARLREFADGAPVWQAACLNCHDTHTVSGARRLLREGTDSNAVPKSGGQAALEETCYECHSSAAGTVLDLSNNQVPDVESDFALPRHMPITSFEQPSGTGEVHDITNADLGEGRETLGALSLANRHAECTDCHHPHRVMKNRSFTGTGDTAAGTHAHQAGHTNLASGVLKGITGVEPLYGSSQFLSLPSSYLPKAGDAGLGASSAVNAPYVTREYQVCLKCHSDYGYSDNGAYPDGNRPALGAAGGSTTPGANGLTMYTNQAMEFQAPAAHQGEVTAGDSGAGAGFTANNHRSWHPVIAPTGRTPAIRSASATAWLAPWNGVADVGTQTMYCTDCHGSNTANNSVVPPGGEDGKPWGPHGSTNDFLLKGVWSAATGSATRDAPAATDPENGLCFKCHDYRTYADRNGNNRDSGFSGSKSSNLHAFHTDKIEHIRCSWCHTAVPHGWKNKALLVNLNDVGPEAGRPGGSEVPILNLQQTYTQEPYYMNAKLKVITFARSGTWEASNCGSASGTPNQGRDWMKEVCSNPP
ncbi:MAG: hypothetical protein HY749_07715 [Gammaproteobacteria bacterium]|nr:hypothetical protein [Gammaproteobacteria bacterium]